MHICMICRFDVELDDVMIKGGVPGHCVCVRCFYREAGTTVSMPKTLRREVQATLSALETA